MHFILKPGQETFEIVDGPGAGIKYEKGVRYNNIPDHESHRFDRVSSDELPEPFSTSSQPQSDSAEIVSGLDESSTTNTPAEPDKIAKKRSTVNA